MEITGVSQHHVEADLAGSYEPTWVPGYAQSSQSLELFRLETDVGLTGLAASPSFGGGLDYATPLSLFLVGEDPHDVGRIRQKLEDFHLLGPRAWHVEIACWDLIGKAADAPIYELLGGTDRPIPAYASTGERQPLEARLDYVDARVAEGFDAVKLRFGPEPEADLEVARRIREAHPDLTLMVDANMGWAVRALADREPWTHGEALSVARELASIGDVAWLEEPLHRHDYDGLARLRAATDVPIAGGEFNDGVAELRELVDRGAVDVLQPDACLATGIQGATQVAAMAQTHGLEFAPHTWTNGIGLAANLHVMAATGARWCEFPLEPPALVPETRDVPLATPIVAEDGAVRPPEGPGLGVELAPAVEDELG